eukprot:jgi/Tetstr1/438365/TSEL_026931.t2
MLCSADDVFQIYDLLAPAEEPLRDLVENGTDLLASSPASSAELFKTITAALALCTTVALRINKRGKKLHVEHEYGAEVAKEFDAVDPLGEKGSANYKELKKAIEKVKAKKPSSSSSREKPSSSSREPESFHRGSDDRREGGRREQKSPNDIPLTTWGYHGGWKSISAQLRYMGLDEEHVLSVSRAILSLVEEDELDDSDGPSARASAVGFAVPPAGAVVADNHMMESDAPAVAAMHLAYAATFDLVVYVRRGSASMRRLLPQLPMMPPSRPPLGGALPATSTSCCPVRRCKRQWREDGYAAAEGVPPAVVDAHRRAAKLTVVQELRRARKALDYTADLGMVSEALRHSLTWKPSIRLLLPPIRSTTPSRGTAGLAAGAAVDDPAARGERAKTGEPLRVRPLGVGSVPVRMASARALLQVDADAREAMGAVQRSFQSGAGCETRRI